MWKSSEGILGYFWLDWYTLATVSTGRFDLILGLTWGGTMNRRSIRAHLAPYSIFQKRRTTINHAFASAIAPVDDYDDLKVSEALRLLGQDPDGDLLCLYCGERATTWDHLIGLVKNAELRGYGHQIGNLVPCCRDCNSKKGARPWETYLREVVPDESAFQAKRRLIADYLTEPIRCACEP